MKYILRVKTHYGVIAHVLDNEDDALAKLRFWSKHPVFIKGDVWAIQMVGAARTTLVAER